MQPTIFMETLNTETMETDEYTVKSPESCTVGMDCIWYDSLGD